MPDSSNILNYHIGKAIASWTPDGGAARELGNAPEIAISPEFDFLEHFSSMAGVRSKDRTVARELGGTCRLVLEEMTPENLSMLLFGGDGGPVAANSAGDKEFNIFSVSEILGALSLVGTNDVGNKFTLILPSVSIEPTGEFGMVSEEWNSIELSAEILLDQASSTFGTLTETQAAS